MSSEQGPPAPLSKRNLTLATLLALALAVLALAVYILPANYGLDPIGTGQAFGINGQPPGESEAAAAPAPELDANTTAEAPQLYSYEAAWPTSTQKGPGAEGYTAENETTTVPLELPANTSTAKVTITWSDDNETAGQETQPDELELVLEAPDGSRTEPVTAENSQGGEGSVTSVLTAGLPSPHTIVAAGTQEARQRALAQAPADLEGTWRAHVRVLEAGDADTGPLAEAGAGEDEGTDWQLTSQATTYTLSLEEQGPADVREDTQRFQLAPGEGMEHKVTLEANQTLAYAWRTTSEVYYDFHGEPENESGFTSHGTGTGQSEDGTFRAPFTGTHGWYWENKGDEPVAIELTTRGDYTDGFTT